MTEGMAVEFYPVIALNPEVKPEMSKSVDVTNEIESLIKKAEKAIKADDALKYSQAALNSAHAMVTLLLQQKGEKYLP